MLMGASTHFGHENCGAIIRCKIVSPTVSNFLSEVSVILFYLVTLNIIFSVKVKKTTKITHALILATNSILNIYLHF